MNAQSKVTAAHLQRDAYLYVRQCTFRQEPADPASTQRQYALPLQALSLGWPKERIVVIDQDQGRSGCSARQRPGWARLMAQVGLGQAGIVMGLEVSRLARHSADWHRFLDLCALTHTLFLDEDGLYDPAHYNDRLVLGRKGTMSQAELRVLSARLLGGGLDQGQQAENALAGPRVGAARIGPTNAPSGLQPQSDDEYRI